MNQPELTLVLIGFGNVARRFVKLLGETADRLDFTWKIVGISTRHHGSVVDPAGVDTRRAITTVEGRQSLDRLDPAAARAQRHRRHPPGRRPDGR